MEGKAHGADFNCVQIIFNLNINILILNKWKRLSQSGGPSEKKKKILLPLLLMDHNYCTSLSMVCGPVQPSFMTKWGKGTHGPTPWGRGKKEKK